MDARSVLVVEDNPVNVEVLIEMLIELGCQSMVAENGRAAIDEFKRERFDAVLMDCQMPVMDGFQAARGVRELERDHERGRTPIIAVTANATESDRKRCFDAGMDDFVKSFPTLAKTLSSSKPSNP
ncbi:MAG: response regulator, partial [Pseudomonadota bacterium]